MYDRPMTGNPDSPWNGSAQHWRYEENYADPEGQEETSMDTAPVAQERQRSTNYDHNDTVPEEQVYTFEDVEEGLWCQYKGRPGVIVDKGDHILEDHRQPHMVVQFTEGSGHPNKRFCRSIVNKYLYEKQKLWIDFENRVNVVEDA